MRGDLQWIISSIGNGKYADFQRFQLEPLKVYSKVGQVEVLICRLPEINRRSEKFRFLEKKGDQLQDILMFGC